MKLGSITPAPSRVLLPDDGTEYKFVTFIDAIMYHQSDKSLEDLSDRELDFMYASVFGHLAYHMSREGYLKSLNEKRSPAPEVAATSDLKYQETDHKGRQTGVEVTIKIPSMKTVPELTKEEGEILIAEIHRLPELSVEEEIQIEREGGYIHGYHNMTGHAAVEGMKLERRRSNAKKSEPVSGVAAPTGGSEAELPFKLPLEFRPHRPLYVSGAITDADGYIIADDALKAKADLLVSYVNSFAKLEGELAALKAAALKLVSHKNNPTFSSDPSKIAAWENELHRRIEELDAALGEKTATKD